MRRMIIAAAAMLSVLVAMIAIATIPDTPTMPTPAAPPAQNAALNRLAIAAPHPMAGYSRDRFPRWRKTGPNCDVRDTVLQRDGENVQLSGCNVTAGRWRSWYDQKTLTTPATVDIDHLVPLADAWRSGADTWNDDKRGDFANDTQRPQLFAVSASANRSKGDQDPSTWKPPDPAAWCDYARDWITVKTYWQLSITQPEHDALAQMLQTCPTPAATP